jgi:3-hydroxyisobutyrate dehydrogenase
MGQPMAEHLIQAGFDVRGFDLSDAAKKALEAKGGTPADTATAAMTDADIAITMLPNGKIVQDALYAADAWKALKPNALIIDMSSSAPTDTRELAEKLSAVGIRLVDAPVSGGVKRAISGTLTIMAGGTEADITEASEVLAALGNNVFRTGTVGSGHAMKAINNFVSGAGVIAAIEGILLAQKFGLDGGTVVDILNSSSGKNNATEVKMKQFILSETYGSGFALGLMSKDIRIAADLAKSLELNLETLAETADAWDAAKHKLGPSEDHTAIFKFLAERA